MFSTKLVEPLTNIDSDSEVYADLYSSIQSEISKTAQPIPESIVWSKLREDCINLLSRHIKDLNVAHYLVLSTLQLEGIDQLSPSLKFICQFIEQNSNTMRPSKGKIGLRSRAVSWMFSAFEKFLERDDIRITKESNIEEMIVWLERYCCQCSDVMGLEVSGPSTVVEKLKSRVILENKIPDSKDIAATQKTLHTDSITNNELAEKNDVIEKPRDISATKEQLDPTGHEPFSDEKNRVAETKNSLPEENRVLRDCRINLMALADEKLRKSMQDPSPYYFRRIAAWISMIKLPDSNSSNETQLKAPNQFEKNELNVALQAADIDTIVRAAESMLDRYPLWLDANIFTLNALNVHGSQYKPCMNSIMSLLRDLLDRFPGLRDLKFSNGESMFGVECQKNSELLYTTSDAKLNNIAIDNTKSDTSTHLPKFNSKGSSMEFNSELVKQQGQLLTCKGLRQEFMLRIAQIQHCMRHRKVDLASAQIDYLWSQVQEIEFSMWEPKLASQLIELQLAAIIAKNSKGKEMKSKNKQRCKELYIHLSGVNACAASRINTTHFEEY